MTSSSPRMTTTSSRAPRGCSRRSGEDPRSARSARGALRTRRSIESAKELPGSPGGRRGGMSPVPDLPDVDAISAAIATCPSVSGLSGGIAGEIATYLPGRRVSGVRASPGSVEVHVVARYGRTLHEIDAEVRAAVAAAVPGVPHVDVVVADVEDPFAPVEEPEPPKELEAGPLAGGTRSAAPSPTRSGSTATTTTL